MNSKKTVVLSFACVAVALSIAPTASAQYVERTIETVRTTDVQVLTSGPVHEAFAETVVYDPEPDVVVLLPPPEPINEEPPDMVPTGPDMTWIPGYWAWDDDRDDYLWVSGIWRSVPPGRSYVPGFWTRVGHGYQWSSGFWIDADATDLEYLPDPPEPIEDAPPPMRPAPNLIWTPGIWVWDMDRYVWRPGHWVEASPDWVWVPAHYVWSPRGYIFVDGYWDFTIAQRGVLFAPVYVSPVMRRSPTFVYAPQLVIDLDIFTEHLFIRPRYRHYYFGDYYAASYVDRGIYPWFTVQARRVAYDPIYVHRRWGHRNEPDWERHIEVSYNRRRDDERERPPRVYSAQIELGDRGKAAVAGFVVAKTLQQMAQANRSGFRQLQQDERNVVAQGARSATKARTERKEVESRDTAAGGEPVKRTTPTRAKLPTPTAIAKKGAASRKAPAPKKPDAPTVDRNVAPKAKAPVQKKVTREPRAQPAQPAEPARPATPAQPTRTAPTMQPSPRPVTPPAPAPRSEPKPQQPDTAKSRPPTPERPSTPEGKSKKEKDKDDKDKGKKKDDD